MKKLMSLILAVALMVSLGVAAFAADSKSDLIEVLPVENATVTEVLIEDTQEADALLEEIQVEMKQTLTEVLDTALAAAEVSQELDEESKKALEDLGVTAESVASGDTKLNVLSIKDIEVDEGKTATTEVIVEGVEDITLAVFIQLPDGTMKLLKVGKPPLKVATEESGRLVIAQIA